MSLHSEYGTRIRPLIDLMDDLRGILKQTPISLPSIAVIGSQSAGKSSVLEALSGVALPRAAGLCTRCPLELRMHGIQAAPSASQLPSTVKLEKKKDNHDKHVANGTTHANGTGTRTASIPRVGEEYATIRIAGESGMDDSDLEFITDFNQVGDYVIKYTRKVAPNDHDIVDRTLILDVYKKNAPDLTLIDLPGIVQIAGKGQPQDIRTKIVDMVLKKISNENTVILNVHMASDDFANSESLRHAYSDAVDPERGRTLIVLSKSDLAGKHIAAKVQGLGSANESYVGNLGCIAVRNRTQEELEKQTTLEQAQQVETTFFTTHPELKDIAQRLCGTQQLASRLVELQHDRIQSTLPHLSGRVSSMLHEKQSELKTLPPALTTETECQQRLIRLIHDLVQDFTDLVDGKYIRINTFIKQIDMHNIRIHATDASAFTHQVKAATNIAPPPTSTQVPTIKTTPAPTAVPSPSTAAASIPSLRSSAAAAVRATRSRAHRDDTLRDTFRVARVLQHLFETFQSSITACGIPLTSTSFMERVCEMIDEYKGIDLPTLLPATVFRELMDQQLQQIKTAFYTLVDQVRQHVALVLQTLIHIHFQPFPHLLQHVQAHIQEIIEKRERKCKKHLDEHMSMEVSRPFTLNPTFMQTVQKQRDKEKKSDQFQDDIQFELDATQEMTITVRAYWDIVCARVTDVIPQRVHYDVVSYMSRRLCDDLQSLLSSSASSMLQLMSESNTMAERRRQLELHIHELEKAMIRIRKTTQTTHN